MWPYIAAVVLVAVVACGYVFRAQLSGLLPDSDVATLLKRADTAVVANRLIEGEGNARDLYQAVLQIDPDNTPGARRHPAYRRGV